MRQKDPHDANDGKQNRRHHCPNPRKDTRIETGRGNTVKLNSAVSKIIFRNWVFQFRRGGCGIGPEMIGESIAIESRGMDLLTESRPRLNVKRSTLGREPISRSKPKCDAMQNQMSPQAYLDVMIRSRGYSTRKYKTTQTGYYAKPTALQRASFSVHVTRLVQHREYKKFKSVLGSGISPNPCNADGESLLHMVCRRGDAILLKLQLDAGALVQVSDDYGRTPLHDVCWRKDPSFEMVELLAEKDLNLFQMKDRHGSGPLSYVCKEQWQRWIDFLETKKDEWWPIKDKNTGGQALSPLIEQFPDSRRIADPPNALTMELAKMVANGSISPEDADLFKFDHGSGHTLTTDCSDDDSEKSFDDDSFVISITQCMDRKNKLFSTW